jgi:hypothetical protein
LSFFNPVSCKKRLKMRLFVFRAVVLFGYPDNTRNLLRSGTAGSF